MKCSKCGQECKEGQRICIKCGTPLPLIPAMGDLEQELAEEIEDFLNGDLNTPRVKNEEYSDTYIEVDEEELFAESEDEPDDEPQDSYHGNIVIGNEFSLDDVENALQDRETKRQADAEERDLVRQRKRQLRLEKKRRKRKIMIGSCAAVVGVIVLVVAGILIRNAWNRSHYQENYDQGVVYVDAGNYAKAIESLEKALKYTGKSEDIIAAKYQMYRAYIALTGYEDEAEKLLRELINLDQENIDYYKALVDLYRSTKNGAAIERLLLSVSDTDLYDLLVDYNVDTPLASVPSGEYGSFVRIDLELLTGTKIYYTLKKDETAPNPIDSGTEYTEQILINEEGTWSLKAVAVSANGAYSEILSEEYIVDFVKPDVPQIQPENGKYNEFTDISVEYSSYDKVYYTIDGEDPDPEDELYKKPIPMERGNHIYKFILVSENGRWSDVVTRYYNLVLDKNYTYDEAVDILKRKLYGQGILKNSTGTYSDNTVLSFDYKGTPLIDKEEYYVISFSMRTDSGKTVADGVLYGIHAITGHVVNVTSLGGGEYEITDDIKLELPTEEEKTTAETEKTEEAGE